MSGETRGKRCKEVGNLILRWEKDEMTSAACDGNKQEAERSAVCQCRW